MNNTTTMMSGAAGPSYTAAAAEIQQHETNNDVYYVNMEEEAAEQNNENPYSNDDQSSTIHSPSSILTADGIHDMTGFCIVCFVILIGDMSRGVMFPTMWPLVEELGGTTIALGYSVAAFSGGRIVVSPIFGSWSVSWGYTKTLILAACILLLGTLCYAQVQNVGSVSFLIFSQLLLGFGSGTLGVTRAFVAEVTAQRNRTQYMALLTAVQYAGFTVTPFFGALFIKLLQNHDYQFLVVFRLNMYTAPAYFMSVIILITLLLLTTLFQDRQRLLTKKDAPSKSQRRSRIDELANTTTMIGLTTYDCCILGCMLLNVSTKGSIASFETLGIQYASSHFSMAPERAGTIVACCGSLGVIALLSMGQFSKILSDIQLICGGMVIMACGIFSLVFVEKETTQYANNASWRYVLAIGMIYSIGYPIGHTAVIGLFSKIVGRRPQGTLMGWFASAGSLARMLFPITSGYIASMDVAVLFVILVVILSLSTVFVLGSRKTLALLST